MRAMTSVTNGQPAHLMTIGEASRRSGFTVKTLRFYERCGVVPTSARQPNGYRIYRETDLGRLEFIRQAKALGLRLGAIGELVGGRFPNGNMRRRLLQMLDSRITETTERITALTSLREELERRRRIVAGARPRGGSREYCTCLKKTESG
jgi:DNA-binding transcriptional MerR regulator